MSIGRSRHSLYGSMRTRTKRNTDQDKTAQRRLLLEQLEDRRLLFGPQLAGIQPNNSELFSFDDPASRD